MAVTLDREVMTLEMARQILKIASQQDTAAIMAAQADRSLETVVITIALDTATPIQTPYRVSFPFRSVFVRSATDSSVQVSLRPNTSDSIQGDIPLKNNDSIVFPSPLAEAYLTWTAQAGKSMTLVFFVSGEFRTGTQVSSTSGGVSITDGDAVSNQATATVTTVAQLFAADTSRKKMMIVNASGVKIYLGDVTTTDDSGTKIGIPMNPGDTYAWENTSACFAVSQGGVSTGQKIGLVKMS